MTTEGPTTERPYHHGSLRSSLLDEAERSVREHGADGLSLRELARRTGVSHAAPRRHFPDRRALLDALAVAGFRRLTDELQQGIDSAGDDVADRLHGAAQAYVAFAMRDGALLELMFATLRAGASRTLHDAADALFLVYSDLIDDGRRAGRLPSGDAARLRKLLVATLQGIAAMHASGRAERDEVVSMVTDAVGLFVRNPSM